MTWRKELLKRTWGFLDDGLLERIGEVTILNAGCGLASNIAVLAAQHGFTRFVNVDSDCVEASNLNRQTFTAADVGRPKVEALADAILAKNPEAILDGSHVGRITPDSAAAFVSLADLVVLTVDFDETLYAVTQAAREQGKPVFAPLNLGFSGFCVILTPEAATIEELVGGQIINDFPLYLERLVSSVEGWRIPRYLEEKRADLAQIMAESENRGIPQLGIAACRSSSIVVESMIKYLAGLPLSVAPRVVTLDSFEA